jgi:hypothetical protein
MPRSTSTFSQSIHPPLSIASLAMIVSTSTATASTDMSGEDLGRQGSRSTNPRMTRHDLRLLLLEALRISGEGISDMEDDGQSNELPNLP